MFNLITLDDLRSRYIGSTLSEDFDVLLSPIIGAVTAIFADHCNLPDFDKKEFTQYFSPGEQRTQLFLNRWPIAPNDSESDPVVTTSVWQSTTMPRVYGNAELLVEDTDYFVDREAALLQKAAGWWASGLRTVKATLTGGYLTANGQGAPPQLKHAAIDQVCMIFDRRRELGLTSKSLEGGSVGMLAPLILGKQVTLVLDPFRRMAYGS